jgi:SAM-dependent methyltransferase
MWSDPILRSIFRRFPPAEVIFKQPSGRAGSEYRLEQERPFHRWFGRAAHELFAERDVLDLGSGFGGSAVRFLEYGARTVTGLEVTADHVEHSTAFARERGVADRVRFFLGTGEATPFADEQFDLITMYDVLEHVISPRDVLAECHRILRPAGVLALAFPPYYDVRNGSHLPGYACRLAWLNLLFTTRQLRSATAAHLDQDHPNWHEYLRDVPTDKLWNLNGLTVGGLHRLVDELPFDVEDIRHIGHHDRRISRKDDADVQRLAPIFAAFEFAARTPLLRELWCSRLCVLLRKPATAASDGERSSADAVGAGLAG